MDLVRRFFYYLLAIFSVFTIFVSVSIFYLLKYFSTEQLVSDPRLFAIFYFFSLSLISLIFYFSFWKSIEKLYYSYEKAFNQFKLSFKDGDISFSLESFANMGSRYLSLYNKISKLEIEKKDISSDFQLADFIQSSFFPKSRQTKNGTDPRIGDPSG